MLIVYLIICALIAFGDIKFRMIPDKIIWIGIALAFLFHLWRPFGIINFFIGMLIGGLSMFAAGMICFSISKTPALGGGDLKLLAMIGAFLGWEIALMTFALAPIFGSIYAGIFNKTRLAYGLFLMGSSLIAIFIKNIFVGGA